VKLLSAFAVYGAGFAVRPFGVVVFGRIGDVIAKERAERSEAGEFLTRSPDDVTLRTGRPLTLTKMDLPEGLVAVVKRRVS
jgi:hypothetical protein